MDVEFIFEGSDSLRDRAKENRSNYKGASDQPVVGPQINKRSGRYRSHAVPKSDEKT